ncbi:MAG: 3-isopropylmalate dehydratase large subunit [Syntrophales bacterium]
MGMTLAEKIFSKHVGRGDVKAGEIVIADLDAMMTHDACRPLGLEVFRRMKGQRLCDDRKVIQIIDHHYPAPGAGNAQAQKKMRQFHKEAGGVFYEGEGICHSVIPEKGHVLPGELVVGTDSHTCTYGALGAFSTGIGSTDMAVAMISGKLWFMVPETIKMNIVGTLPPGVFAKDLILYIIASVTADGATYQAVEFTGPVIEALSMDARFTMSNMAIEMGAKAGMMAPDRTTLEWVNRRKPSRQFTPLVPDADARYVKEMTFDVSNLPPYVAKPHRVDNGAPIEEVLGTPIDQGSVSTCTAARIEDLRIAAAILKNKKVAQGVRFIVVPSSKEVLKMALDEGIISTLLDAGAHIKSSSCAACSGGSGYALLADDEVAITTANRNFQGRLGNPKSFIYLASPATVAASVLEGKIADPRHCF